MNLLNLFIYGYASWDNFAFRYKNNIINNVWHLRLRVPIITYEFVNKHTKEIEVSEEVMRRLSKL